jgi:hypothetical protein
MMDRICYQIALFVIAMNLLMGSAAAQPWISAPIREGHNIPDSLDLSEGSLLLLPVTFKNIYKPDHLPLFITVHIQNLGRKLGNTKAQDFFKFDKTTNASGLEEIYLIALLLKPGSYTIQTINGATGIFPIRPQFQYSLTVPLVVKEKGKVIYLGRLGIKNIQRTNSKDQASGFLTPLIDQAIAGFSDGTLEFELRDLFALDKDIYQNKFEILKSSNIESALLPAISFEPAMGAEAGLRVVKMTPEGKTPAARMEFEKITGAHAPSNFAAIDDVNAVPYVNEQGRKGYVNWLQRQSPKAFVISEEGRWNSDSGNHTIDKNQSADPVIRAMRACQSRGLKSCALYAVDSNVVYQPSVAGNGKDVDKPATATKVEIPMVPQVNRLPLTTGDEESAN